MDGLGKEPRLVRVQYLNLVGRRARRYEGGKNAAVTAVRTSRKSRARRRPQASPTQAVRPQASGAPEYEKRYYSELRKD